MIKELITKNGKTGEKVEFAIMTNTLPAFQKMNNHAFGGGKSSLINHIQNNFYYSKKITEYHAWSKNKEIPSKNCVYFLLSNDTTTNKKQVAYFPNEEKFIQHMEDLRRKSIHLINSIWDNSIIDTFILAYLFFRDELQKEYVLIRANLLNGVVEYAFRGIKDQCFLYAANYKEEEKNSLMVKIHRIVALGKSYPIEENDVIIDNAYSIQTELSTNFDTIKMNNVVLSLCNKLNLSFQSEKYFYVEENSGAILRRFLVVRNDSGEVLTLTIHPHHDEVTIYDDEDNIVLHEHLDSYYIAPEYLSNKKGK